MSGGYFNYNQYKISEIAHEIEQLIRNNDDTAFDEWDEPIGRGYSESTIEKFKLALKTLREAEVMTQRIDWLLSGDDSEASFHRRWHEDMQRLCERE